MRLSATFILLTLVWCASAQQRIILPDGESIKVNSLEIGEDSLSYRSGGETNSLSKKDLLLVLDSAGNTQMFYKYHREVTRSDNTWSPHTIGVGGTYFIPVRADTYSDPDGFDFKAGFGVTLKYQYNFQKLRYLSIRATLDYQKSSGRGDSLGSGLATMEVVPLTVGLKAYPGKRKNFYFVADVGAGFTAYRARFIRDDFKRTDVANQVGFTAGFGIGYDFRITDEWHIEIDHTVRWLKASDRDDSTSNFYLRLLYNI